jgi:hypothetical protein
MTCSIKNLDAVMSKPFILTFSIGFCIKFCRLEKIAAFHWLNPDPGAGDGMLYLRVDSVADKTV